MRLCILFIIAFIIAISIFFSVICCNNYMTNFIFPQGAEIIISFDKNDQAIFFYIANYEKKSFYYPTDTYIGYDGEIFQISSDTTFDEWNRYFKSLGFSVNIENHNDIKTMIVTACRKNNTDIYIGTVTYANNILGTASLSLKDGAFSLGADSHEMYQSPFLKKSIISKIFSDIPFRACDGNGNELLFQQSGDFSISSQLVSPITVLFSDKDNAWGFFSKKTYPLQKISSAPIYVTCHDLILEVSYSTSMTNVIEFLDSAKIPYKKDTSIEPVSKRKIDRIIAISGSDNRRGVEFKFENERITYYFVYLSTEEPSLGIGRTPDTLLQGPFSKKKMIDIFGHSYNEIKRPIK